MVTLLPTATVEGDTDGVVARGMVVPVNVSLMLALPRATLEAKLAATARDRVPSALWEAVKLPEAMVLLLPLASPRISNVSPVYLRVPPMVTVIDAPPVFQDAPVARALTFKLHDILPLFVAADVPDSETVSTSVAQPELKFF